MGEICLKLLGLMIDGIRGDLMPAYRFPSKPGFPWTKRFAISISILIIMVLVGCSRGPEVGIPPSGGAQTPVLTATPDSCADPLKVVDSFYAANNASRFDESLTYLTDDIAFVTWAEGANGHHMVANFAVGKDQIQDYLGKPGLKSTASGANLPNYSRTEVTQSGNKLSFKLNADRAHPDGRPYNSFVVELVFSGCKIEIIKLVERVAWL
jgi:hypothetical protein